MGNVYAILFFFCISLFSSYEPVYVTDGRTNSRTGKTRNAAYSRGVQLHGSGNSHGNGIPWESHGNGNTGSRVDHDGNGMGMGVKAVGMGIAYISCL